MCVSSHAPCWPHGPPLEELFLYRLMIFLNEDNKIFLFCFCLNSMQRFKKSIIFIHESRLKGEGCLVHCLAGVSRSVTLVVAYIMTMTSLGWQEALAAVRVVRPCASPNGGFQTQLQEFETTQIQQFREWLKEEYKENPFNDEEDIHALLAQIPSGPGQDSGLLRDWSWLLVQSTEGKKATSHMAFLKDLCWLWCQIRIMTCWLWWLSTVVLFMDTFW